MEKKHSQAHLSAYLLRDLNSPRSSHMTSIMSMQENDCESSLYEVPDTLSNTKLVKPVQPKSQFNQLEKVKVKETKR